MGETTGRFVNWSFYHRRVNVMAVAVVRSKDLWEVPDCCPQSLTSVLAEWTFRCSHILVLVFLLHKSLSQILQSRNKRSEVMYKVITHMVNCSFNASPPEIKADWTFSIPMLWHSGWDKSGAFLCSIKSCRDISCNGYHSVLSKSAAVLHPLWSHSPSHP